jgi:protein phosphatase
VRKNNEDSWFADSEQGLYIVSDGMGGAAAGEVASKMVVETLPLVLRERLHSLDNLTAPDVTAQVRQAFVEVNGQMRAQSRVRPELGGMGATVVLAFVRAGQALLAHAGDSRCYLLRHGELKRMTKDHSMIQVLIDAGQLKPEDAHQHPDRAKITQCMGTNGEVIPDVTVVELKADDRILLCSDGLTNMVNDAQLTALLINYPDPNAACSALIAAANEAGGQDNITAIVIAIDRSA